MLHLIVVALATFWAWETVRFALSEYAPGVLASTGAAHPLVVAALPLYLLWPDWVSALAVAGLVGLIHLTASRYMPDPTPVYPQRQPGRRGGLPPLP